MSVNCCIISCWRHGPSELSKQSEFSTKQSGRSSQPAAASTWTLKGELPKPFKGAAKAAAERAAAAAAEKIAAARAETDMIA